MRFYKAVSNTSSASIPERGLPIVKPFFESIFCYYVMEVIAVTGAKFYNLNKCVFIYGRVILYCAPFIVY